MGRQKDNEQRSRIDSMETRAKILAAAEELFAKYGISEVTDSMIRVVAGQRNRSVIHYHFGDKDGIIREILEKHERSIRQKADNMLESVRCSRKLTTKDIARALVITFVDKLKDPGGGVAYIQLMDQLVGYRNFKEVERYVDYVMNDDGPLAQISRRVYQNPGGQQIWILQMIMFLGLVVHAIADYLRLCENAQGRSDLPSLEIFTNCLIDIVVSVMETSMASWNNNKYSDISAQDLV